VQIKIEIITTKKPILDVGKATSGIRDAMDKTLMRGKNTWTQYPPQPAGSRYRRTGTLGRSISTTINAVGGRLEGVLGSNSNIAPYNDDVIGIEQQDVFKRIGWIDAKEVGEMMESELKARVDKALDSAVKE